MWRMMNLYQRGVTLWHDYARRISCGHAAINIVVCRAVFQQVAAAGGHQPFVSHFSLTCPLIKSSVRRNLTTAIVFDTGRKRREGASEALTVPSHAVL